MAFGPRPQIEGEGKVNLLSRPLPEIERFAGQRGGGDLIAYPRGGDEQHEQKAGSQGAPGGRGPPGGVSRRPYLPGWRGKMDAAIGRQVPVAGDPPVAGGNVPLELGHQPSARLGTEGRAWPGHLHLAQRQCHLQQRSQVVRHRRLRREDLGDLLAGQQSVEAAVERASQVTRHGRPPLPSYCAAGRQARAPGSGAPLPRSFRASGRSLGYPAPRRSAAR